jgi:hypothetical protein
MLQCQAEAMAVAFLRVQFCTHEGDRMIERIKEKMQILPYERSNDVLIVPVPNDVSRSSFNGFGANVTGNP